MSKYDKMRHDVHSDIFAIQDELMLQDDIAKELWRLSNVAHNAGAILTDLDREFAEVTELNQADVAFLFLAIALQCARQYVVTPFEERLPAAEAEKKTKGKENGKKEKVVCSHRLYRPSFIEVCSNPVPFDISRQSDQLKGVLKGAGKFGHRLVLGHDPILGWIFGTGNIATSTITTWDFRSYHVKSKPQFLIANNASTPKVLFHTKERLLNQGAEGKIIIAASIVKEYLHLKSDLYSKRSLPFPIVSTISPKIPNMLAKYGIDMANIADISKQAASAQMINLIIAMMHGLSYYLLQGQASEILNPDSFKNICTHKATGLSDLDFHKVKTRKILSYSNVVASTSNILVVSAKAAAGALTQNPEMTEKSLRYLDVGGILVTLYRLISDHKFIQQIKREFLQNRWQEIVQGNDF